jgi:hypothetical protein
LNENHQKEDINGAIYATETGNNIVLEWLIHNTKIDVHNDSLITNAVVEYVRHGNNDLLDLLKASGVSKQRIEQVEKREYQNMKMEEEEAKYYEQDNNTDEDDDESFEEY